MIARIKDWLIGLVVGSTNLVPVRIVEVESTPVNLAAALLWVEYVGDRLTAYQGKPRILLVKRNKLRTSFEVVVVFFPNPETYRTDQARVLCRFRDHFVFVDVDGAQAMVDRAIDSFQHHGELGAKVDPVRVFEYRTTKEKP